MHINTVDSDGRTHGITEPTAHIMVLNGDQRVAAALASPDQGRRIDRREGIRIDDANRNVVLGEQVSRL